MLIAQRLSLDYTLLRSSISKKRPSSCDIRARYCDALCAARMTQFLYMLSCSFRFDVPAIAGCCARASCTRWCGDTRALCAQQWFGWAMNVPGYRLSRAAQSVAAVGCHIPTFGHHRQPTTHKCRMSLGFGHGASNRFAGTSLFDRLDYHRPSVIRIAPQARVFLPKKQRRNRDEHSNARETRNKEVQHGTVELERGLVHP